MMETRTQQPKNVAASGLSALLLGASLMVACASPVWAFHFPWDQGHDTTDWDDPDDPGPCEGPNCDPCKSTGSPVYIPTGHVIWTETDIGYSGRPSLSVSRTYNSNDPRVGVFGNGWSSGCEVQLVPVAASVVDPATGSEQIVTDYVLVFANGKRYVFETDRSTVPIPPGASIVSPPGRSDRVEPQLDGTVDLVDESGAVMTFNGDGDLLSTAEPSGQVLTYTYGSQGLLTRIADDNGRFLDFAYNTAGFVSSIVDHGNRTWSYSYDADGNLIRVDDPAGGARRYAYVSYTPVGDGNTYYHLASITDAAGVVISSFTYSNGRVVTHTRGENTHRYAYNDGSNQVTKTDSIGSQWRFTYNEEQVVTQVRDPRGNTETFEYDENGNLTRYVDYNGDVWTADYDDAGRRLSVTNPLNDTTVQSYQAENPRPVSFASPSGQSSTFSYNAQGNVSGITDASGATSTLTWNSQGEVSGIRNALDNEISVTYNGFGLAATTTDAVGRTASFGYDDVGNLVSIQNAVGEQYQFTYDNLNRLTSIVGASGQTISYTRGIAGRIETMTDAAGNVISSDWDEHGRLASRTFADGRTVTFGRRADNLISTVVAPGGTTTTYQYDAAKNLTRIDANGEVTTFEYDQNNQLVRASNSTGTVDIVYDALGRITSESTNGVAITYEYNSDGQRTTMVSPAGETHYSYDARGLITRIAAPEGNYDIGYDALGRRSSLSYPNGVSSSWGYNDADQLVSLSYSGPFSASFGLSYGQDGLIAARTGEGANWTYQYDADGALMQAVHGVDSFGYTYDAAGNHVGEGQVVDNANRVLQDASFDFTYDQRGNLLTKTARDGSSRVEYTWNGRNKLIRYAAFDSADPSAPAVRVIEYRYGPLGRLWSRTENGVTERYVYDRGDRILTLDSAGAVIETVTHGTAADEPLSVSNAQGRRYLHARYDGSIVALTDATGVTDEYSYSPFGQTTVERGTFDNSYRFTGRQQEADDLYYYRSRFYDPTTRRYLSEDPAGYVAGELNLYRYVGNNPINFADPSGEIWPAIIIIWGAVEVGLAIYDAYDTYQTVFDPCTGTWEKIFAGTIFVAGAALPGGGYSKADDVVKAADNYVDDAVDIADEGVIYRVPGEATESGKPYIGRTDDLDARTRNGRDGRDRSQAEVIDTYPKGDTDAARAAEQRAINENGGVPNLDNKRNEIAPSKWGDFGIND